MKEREDQIFLETTSPIYYKYRDRDMISWMFLFLNLYMALIMTIWFALWTNDLVYVQESYSQSPGEIMERDTIRY